MSNDFINPKEKKIIMINKKKSEVCKNLTKIDLSKRRTLEEINFKLLDSYIESSKKAKNIDEKLYFLALVRKLSNEIKADLKDKIKKEKEKKLSLEKKYKLEVENKKVQITKETPKPIQNVNKNKAIPFAGGLTKDIVEKNWHLIRPCDPNEPLIKKPKRKSGSFFISNAYKYY